MTHRIIRHNFFLPNGCLSFIFAPVNSTNRGIKHNSIGRVRCRIIQYPLYLQILQEINHKYLWCILRKVKNSVVILTENRQNTGDRSDKVRTWCGLLQLLWCARGTSLHPDLFNMNKAINFHWKQNSNNICNRE